MAASGAGQDASVPRQGQQLHGESGPLEQLRRTFAFARSQGNSNYSKKRFLEAIDLYTIALEAVEEYDRECEPVIREREQLLAPKGEAAGRRLELLQSYLAVLANRAVSNESALRPHAALRDARRLVTLLDPWMRALAPDGSKREGAVLVLDRKMPYNPDTALFRLATAHAICGSHAASIRVKRIADARRAAADKAAAAAGEKPTDPESPHFKRWIDLEKRWSAQLQSGDFAKENALALTGPLPRGLFLVPGPEGQGQEESKDAANGLSVDGLTDDTLRMGLFPAPGALPATALLALRKAAAAGAAAFGSASESGAASSGPAAGDSAGPASSPAGEHPLEVPIAEELPGNPKDPKSWPTIAGVVEQAGDVGEQGKPTAAVLIKALAAARRMAATARLALRQGQDPSVAESAVTRGLQILQLKLDGKRAASVPAAARAALERHKMPLLAVRAVVQALEGEWDDVQADAGRVMARLGVGEGETARQRATKESLIDRELEDADSVLLLAAVAAQRLGDFRAAASDWIRLRRRRNGRGLGQEGQAARSIALCSQALSNKRMYKEQKEAIEEAGGYGSPVKPPAGDTGVVVGELIEGLHDTIGEVEDDEVVGGDGGEDDSEDDDDSEADEDEDEEPEDLDTGDEPPPQMRVVLCKHTRGPMPPPVPVPSNAATLTRGVGPTRVLVLVDLDFRLSERVAQAMLGPAIAEEHRRSVESGQKMIRMLQGEVQKREAVLQQLMSRAEAAGAKRPADLDQQVSNSMSVLQQMRMRLQSVIQTTQATAQSEPHVRALNLRNWRMVDWSREQAVIVLSGPRRGWLEDDGSDPNGFVRWLSGAVPGTDRVEVPVNTRPPLGHICFGVLTCTHSGYFQQTSAYAITIAKLMQACGAEQIVEIAEVDTAKGPNVLHEVAAVWCDKTAKAIVKMANERLLGPSNLSAGLPRSPETFDYLAVACDGESMGWRGGDGRPPTGAKGEDGLIGMKRLQDFAMRATPRSAAHRLRPVPIRLLSVRGVGSGKEPAEAAAATDKAWDETRSAGAPDLLELRFEVADPLLTLAPHFGVAGFLGPNGAPQPALKSGGELGIAGGLSPGDAVGLLLPEPEDLANDVLKLLRVSKDAEAPAPAYITQEYPQERIVPSFRQVAKQITQALPSEYPLDQDPSTMSFVLQDIMSWDTSEDVAPFQGRSSLPDAEIPRRTALHSEDGTIPEGLPSAPLPPVVDASPASVRQREVCRIGEGLGKLWKLSSAQPQLLDWCRGCLQLHAAQTKGSEGDEAIAAELGRLDLEFQRLVLARAAKAVEGPAAAVAARDLELAGGDEGSVCLHPQLRSQTPSMPLPTAGDGSIDQAKLAEFVRHLTVPQVMQAANEAAGSETVCACPSHLKQDIKLGCAGSQRQWLGHFAAALGPVSATLVPVSSGVADLAAARATVRRAADTGAGGAAASGAGGPGQPSSASGAGGEPMYTASVIISASNLPLGAKSSAALRPGTVLGMYPHRGVWPCAPAASALPCTLVCEGDGMGLARVVVMERLRTGAAGKTTVVAIVPAVEAEAAGGDGAEAAVGTASATSAAGDGRDAAAGALPVSASGTEGECAGDAAVAAAARATSVLGELRALSRGGHIDLVVVSGSTSAEAGARARAWRQGIDGSLDEKVRDRLLAAGAADGAHWLQAVALERSAEACRAMRRAVCDQVGSIWFCGSRRRIGAIPQMSFAVTAAAFAGGEEGKPLQPGKLPPPRLQSLVAKKQARGQFQMVIC